MITLANRWPVALVLLSSGLARAAASDFAPQPPPVKPPPRIQLAEPSKTLFKSLTVPRPYQVPTGSVRRSAAQEAAELKRQKAGPPAAPDPVQEAPMLQGAEEAPPATAAPPPGTEGEPRPR